MHSEHQVTLTVPAQPEFLRVARVTASGLASRLGFGIDDVDDLRLALDELCFALIGKGESGGELHLRYVIGEATLTIEGESRGIASVQPLTVSELSRQILTALVDDHQLWDSEGNGNFRLVKKQADAA